MARERVAVVERKGKVSSDEAAAGSTTIHGTSRIFRTA